MAVAYSRYENGVYLKRMEEPGKSDHASNQATPQYRYRPLPLHQTAPCRTHAFILRPYRNSRCQICPQQAR